MTQSPPPLPESDSSPKRVITNASFLFFANIYRVAFNMALFFVVARVIGAAELGRYSFALSYAALFSVAVHLGLNDLIVRQVAVHKDQSHKYFTGAVLVKTVAGIIVTAVTAVAIGVSGKPTAVQELVLAAALSASLVAGIETVVVAFFYAFERMSYILVQGILRATLNAVAGVGAALLGWGARGILWGFLAVELICALYALVGVKSKLKVWFAPISLREIGDLLRRSVPFGLKGIFTTIYMQIQFSLLSFFAGDLATGTYAASAKLITFLSFVPSALTQALYPYLSRLYRAAGEDRPAHVATIAIRYLSLIALPAALYLSLRSSTVVALAYGNEYALAAPVLVILACAIPFVFGTYPLAVALDAVHRERANTAVAAGAAVLNVGANILLIPWGGIRGAAAAYLITEAGQYVARHILTRIWLGRLEFAKRVGPAFIPAAAMATAMFFTRSLPWLAEFGVLSLVYGATAFLVKAIRPRDVEMLLRRNPKLP